MSIRQTNRPQAVKNRRISSAFIGIITLFGFSAVATNIGAGGTVLSANTNDVLAGGFENWAVINNVPTNWDVAGKLIPDKWGVEDRPDEKGVICRMVNSPDGSDASFGKYSLLLNGRLVSQHVYDKVLTKQFQVSLMAKGQGGNIIVRLREYKGPTNSIIQPLEPLFMINEDGLEIPRIRLLAHIAEIINARTGAEWHKYTGKAVVHCVGAGRITGVSLEIIGKDVVIDNVQDELSDNEYKRIKPR